jgi:hypothetical protein
MAILVGVAVGYLTAWCFEARPGAVFSCDGTSGGAFQFHPDSRLLAIISAKVDFESDDARYSNWDSRLRFIDSLTGQGICQWRIEQNLRSQSPLFSPSGELLAIDERSREDDTNSRIMAFDGWRGTQRVLFELPYGHEKLWFTPDARRLVSRSAGSGPRLSIWDSVSQTWPESAQLSSERGWTVWDLKDGARVGTFKTNLRDLSAQNLSADCRLLAVNHKQDQIQTGFATTEVWDVETGRSVDGWLDLHDRRTGRIVRFDLKREIQREVLAETIQTLNLGSTSTTTLVSPITSGGVTLFDECDGWQLTESSSRIRLHDSQGREFFSMYSEPAAKPGAPQAIFRGRFVRDTDLLVFEREWRVASQGMGEMPVVKRLVVPGVRRQFHLINRRIGKTVWNSSWHERRSGDLRYHTVSPDGWRLAEKLDDGHRTVIRFWSLPVRQWHRWAANGLGVVAAAMTWWLGRRSRRAPG